MNDKDDTRNRLLHAAGEVFAEKGFKGATVREIIGRAGVNIAAINYYFRDKERLYIEAVKSACNLEPQEASWPAWPPETPASVKLRDFIHTIVRSMLDPASPAWRQQLLYRELAQPTAACAELVQNRIRPMAQVLMSILQELLPGVPDVKRRLIAFSIVGQCLYHRVAKPIVALLVGEEEYSTYNAKLLAGHITQFSFAAIGLEVPEDAPGASKSLPGESLELAGASPEPRGQP